MKSTVLALAILALILSCDQRSASEDTSSTLETTYDSAMAATLGADAYGMRQYVMAFLKEGPDRNQDSITSANIQRAHLDNITRMAEEGTLVFAGPLMDNFEVKGIYIFAVETLEEAEKLTLTDPAVKAGRLEMELHPFYGSAALMKVNEIHEKIARQGI